jgi:hypothetical protein
MPGAPLDEKFEDMVLGQKKAIFAQMAQLLQGLQSFKVPETITGFGGGVTFDNADRIVSAAMPTVGAGPWPSYEASFRGRLDVALKKADANPYIKGWHANGLRERLDKFVANGVPTQFEGLGSKNNRVVVHSDFSESHLSVEPGCSVLTVCQNEQMPVTSCLMHTQAVLPP